MNSEKHKSAGAISFEKNTNDSYYTITTTNDEGVIIKFQALIFDGDKIQKEIEKHEKEKHSTFEP